MKPSKATVSILSLIASGSLGVDAMVFDDTVLIPKQDIIANERVEVKQVDNIVEARAPWKGEPGINIKYDMGEPTFTDRIKDRRKKEAIYETVDFGDGGFKVDVLLTEKPDTNRFCYTIEGAENYDFFYQPPLTEQEKAEGSSRPPEIEGSYAVYHKTLANHRVGAENYATGKVMHIPRPQVWSMSDVDTKVWADMDYQNGQLCVTAPQDFLDKSTYPVRIDPTFGYTSSGASQLAYNASTSLVASVVGSYVATAGDTITNFSTWGAKATAPNATTSLAAFSVVGGVVTNQLAEKVQIVLTILDTPTLWTTASFSQSPVAGTGYAVAFSGENAGSGVNGIYIQYDAGTTPGRFNSTLTVFPGAGNSFSPTGTDSGRHYSIYVTYTTIPQTILRLNNGIIRINNGTLDL